MRTAQVLVLTRLERNGCSRGWWEALGADSLDHRLLLRVLEPSRGFALGGLRPRSCGCGKLRGGEAGTAGLAGLPAQPEESEEFQEAPGPRREPFEYLGHPSKEQMNIYLFVWWGSLGFRRLFFPFFFFFSLLLSNLSFAAGTRGVRSRVLAACLPRSFCRSRSSDAGQVTRA